MPEKFRLESVLRYRRNLERKWQAEVAGTMAAVTAVRSEIDRLQRDRGQSLRRLHESLVGRGVTPGVMRSYSDFVRGTDRRIVDQSEILEKARAILAKKQAILLAETKKRKVVERLKEIHADKRQREDRAAEQKQLDDVAAQRHNSRQDR